MTFEDKIIEIVNRSTKLYNITDQINNQDQKVAFGLKEAPKNVEYYGLVFERSNSSEPSEVDESPFSGFFTSSKFDKSEQLIINFIDFKKETETSLVKDTDSDVIGFGNTFKTKLFESVTMEIEFKNSKIYETSDVDYVNTLYKQLLLKERSLNKVKAEKYRNLLMSY